jgi:iron(III) transport system substrate-binding protein
MNDDQFVEALDEQRFSRGAFVRRGLAAGVGLSAAGALLGSADIASAFSGSLDAEAATSPQWAALIDAARKEGNLLLYTLVGDPFSNMAKSFGERYGISVEVTQGRIADLSTKMLAERQAGKYNVDALYQTWSVMDETLLPANALLPVKPALVSPEAINPKKWVDSRILYLDKQKTFLPVIGRLPAMIFTYNTQKLNPHNEPKTLEELLKYQGEIQVSLLGQSGDDALQWMYWGGHQKFLKDLGATKPPMVVDLTAGFRSLALGDFTILIGGTQVRLDPLVRSGLPLKAVGFLPKEKPTVGMVTYNAATPALAANAPHPNAAKLFVNWMMGREGGTLAAKAGGNESLRKDVPKDLSVILSYDRIDSRAYADHRYTIEDLKVIGVQEKIRALMKQRYFNY